MPFYSIAYVAFLACAIAVSRIKQHSVWRGLLLALNFIYYAISGTYSVLILLAITLLTYFMGRLIGKTQKRWLLAVSIFLLISPLLLYKYGTYPFNGITFLPIGISFYTFQALGYIFDIYSGKIAPEKNYLDLSLFLTFFPQMLAGPISRANSLLPQLKNRTTPTSSNVASGMMYMAYGLFLKVFCASALSVVVDTAYNDVSKTTAFMLVIATVFYGIQIYCDFYGYTLMAQGSAKCLGINLASNFEHPYFSTSITEFWRRWHISLSSWFRDYVYIPLGGSRCRTLRASVNLLITFVISGIWHGASINFALWGLLNGVFLVIERLTGLRDNRNRSPAKKVLCWIYTYSAINFLWIFFRADTIGQAFDIIDMITARFVPELLTAKILPTNFFSSTQLWNLGLSVIGIFVIICVELAEKRKATTIFTILHQKSAVVRWIVYLAIILISLCFGQYGNTSSFIYSRF